MSTDVKSIADKLRSSGLLRTQGLIGGKWTDAYDGKTLEVWMKHFDNLWFSLFCSVVSLLINYSWCFV